MFFSGFILAVVTIIYFITGVLAQRVVCDSFRNPTESQLIEVVDKMINLNKTAGVDAKISEILTNCHKNQSIYNVFKLKTVFDISKVDGYLKDFDIETQLDDLANSVNFDFTDFNILNPDTIEDLRNLADSGLDNINFDKFTDIVC